MRGSVSSLKANNTFYAVNIVIRFVHIAI